MSSKDYATAPAGRAPAALLSVEGVTVRFGGVTALNRRRAFRCGAGPDLRPHRAERGRQDDAVQLHLPPLSAERRRDPVRGPAALARPRHRIAGLGVARTFQNLALFATMSVRENVRVGAHAFARGGFLAQALALPLASAPSARSPRSPTRSSPSAA